MKQNNTRHQ